MPGRRFAARIGLAVAALFGGGCSLPTADAVDCPGQFDTAKWKTTAPGKTRQTLAHQVVDCGFVRRGETRRRVAAILGRARRDELQSPSEYRREWTYLIGETNGALGPADAQDLDVSFTRDGRVSEVTIAPP
jgi:hypothetical protein